MSLLIALAGNNKVVVSADSRGMWADDSPAGDNFEKLFQCGRNSVCGIVGILDPISSRVGALCARTDLHDEPLRLLEAIRDDVQGPIAAFYLNNPAPELALAFGAIVFRREPGGLVDFLELEFTVAETASGSRVQKSRAIKRHVESAKPGRFSYTVGNVHPVTADMAHKIDPDSGTDYAILRDVDAIYEVTSRMEHGAGTGGPIDVACLDADGFRWVRHKKAAEPGTLPVR